MTSNGVQQPTRLPPGIKEVFISADDIQRRVTELGQAISIDYVGLNPLLVGVLKGVVIFMADLLRTITIPLEVDFMAVSNYSGKGKSGGQVRLEKDLSASITGRHVLFIEDVIDTGLKLNYLLHNLQTRQPASLEVCVLFNKPSHRLMDVPIKYKGFDLPDRFVVGYGLDYQERYRNLPFLGLLSSQALRTRKGN